MVRGPQLGVRSLNWLPSRVECWWWQLSFKHSVRRPPSCLFPTPVALSALSPPMLHISGSLAITPVNVGGVRGGMGNNNCHYSALIFYLLMPVFTAPLHSAFNSLLASISPPCYQPAFSPPWFRAPLAKQFKAAPVLKCGFLTNQEYISSIRE